MARPASAPRTTTIVLLLCLGSGLLACRTVDGPAPKASTPPAASTASTDALKNATEAGHAATVRCLRSERALTDGNELRCEDWHYVSSNYTSADASGR